MKKMFTIHPDGTYTTNDKESPLAADMVVYHTDNGNLKIEAPCNGCFSTADQRRTVNTLAGKWLESKKSLKFSDKAAGFGGFYPHDWAFAKVKDPPELARAGL